MNSSEIIAFIVIPLVVFLLTSTAGGIATLVKFVGYMARTQAAQEDTAKTNTQMATDLRAYMQKTDSTLLNHTTKLAVHDSEINSLRNGHRRDYG